MGKGNRLPMADFRAMLERLGHSDVKTLLNSGNAVFTSSSRSTRKLAVDIAAATEEQFDVSTPVVVKSAQEFAAVVTFNPIVPPESEHSRFLVAFAMDAAKLKELGALRSLIAPGERFVVTDHAAYLHCAGGLLDSKLGVAILGKAGRYVTTRNWGTVMKIAALLEQGSAQ